MTGWFVSVTKARSVWHQQMYSCKQMGGRKPFMVLQNSAKLI